nr:hypothetical protein CFP56_64762 [Quercus suber]
MNTYSSFVHLRCVVMRRDNPSRWTSDRDVRNPTHNNRLGERRLSSCLDFILDVLERFNTEYRGQLVGISVDTMAYVLSQHTAVANSIRCPFSKHGQVKHERVHASSKLMEQDSKCRFRGAS